MQLTMQPGNFIAQDPNLVTTTAPPGSDWWDTQGLNYPIDVNHRVGITDPGQGGNKDASFTGAMAPPQDFGNLGDPTTWMAMVNNPAQLRAWVKQGLGPTADDQLIDYYAEKVKGQPGANLTEQQGSANYWMDKFKADPKITGQAPAAGGGNWTGGSGAGAPGSVLYNPKDLTAGFTSSFQAPSAEQAAATPGYQFALDAGLQGIDRGAASKGTLLTMGNMKDRAAFATGLADQTYGHTYDRAMSEYKNAFDIFNSNQSNLFNRNYALSGQGLQAAGGQAGSATNIGRAGADAATNAAQAKATGSITNANNNAAIATTVGQLGTTLLDHYAA